MKKIPSPRVVALCLVAVFSVGMPKPSSAADIEKLLAEMTVDEKVGQMCLRGFGSSSKNDPRLLEDAVRAGKVGAMLNVMDKAAVDRLQEIAVKESRLGIPLIFGRDVIHGFKTIFPIPLGQTATWNPEIVELGARISAIEASTHGIRWTFAPMLDIARDARWGRIAESPGEDPFLASVMARAAVRGFQGEDLTSPTSLAACAKHFVGYGAAEGGRDYNTAYIPEPLMRNVYLPPFEAAAEEGALSFMTSFNEVNGIPATAHEHLLRTILRSEWGSDGFVVSDWNSVTEMIAHGYSADARHAADQAATAGLDMEMVSRAYEEHLADLVADGTMPIEILDGAVLRILKAKKQLGLFESPERRRDGEETILSEKHLEAAREAARQSAVLLKNENAVLPLKDTARVAAIGPLTDATHEQLGTWIFDGRKKDSQTPLTALRERLGERLTYAPGLAISRTRTDDGFAAAQRATEGADVIVFFGGEESILSGEAHSRADIRLPGAQQELLRELAATGKPVVLVILAGRPIALNEILDDVDAVLMAWHPGTMAGPALVDLLFGDVSPSGRLPVAWPKAAGQIPIYYNHKNTGRPATDESVVLIDDIPVEAWQSSLGNTSHYLDLGRLPQFPFGFGLTYSKFEYNDLKVTPSTIATDGTLEVSATIKNTGSRTATEIVQLYVRDLVGSLTRPVRELKGFERVELGAGEERRVTFELPASELAFYNHRIEKVIEPGMFKVWIGPNAAEGLEGSFEVQ